MRFVRWKRRGWFVIAVGLLAGGAAIWHSLHGSRAVAVIPSLPRLPRSPREIPVGTHLPALVLRDQRGQPLALGSLRGSPTLLVFFSTSSCPSCRKQLGAFARAAPGFRAAGVEVLAISPDSPEILADLQRELGLPMRLLSDIDAQAVTALCGGLSHCEILTDSRGLVRWGAFSESWSQAPAPETLAEAARRQLSTSPESGG